MYSYYVNCKATVPAQFLSTMTLNSVEPSGFTTTSALYQLSEDIEKLLGCEEAKFTEER